MKTDNASVDANVISADDLMFEELEERMAPSVLIPPHGSSSSSSCSSQQ